MKKILLMLLASGSFASGIAQNIAAIPPAVQCINGPSTITVGQTVTFSSGNIAQCTSCYDWDINGSATSSDNQTVGTVKIVNSDMNQSVSIQGVAAGTFSLQLTYFDETGCHTCSVSGTVAPAPANCCSPVLGGWFECRGSGPQEGGQILINNPSTSSGCMVDWSKISQITIELNGAVFIGSDDGLSFITINGPFTGPIGKTVVRNMPGCAYGNSFGAIVTFYYNNGCATVQKAGNYFDYNTQPIGAMQKKQSERISVSPNPATSVLKFEGKDLNKYKLSLFDTNGNEVLKSKLEGSVNIANQKNGVYIYVITDEKGYRQQGKIIKK